LLYISSAGSLNYGCQPAPPPVPEKSFPHNLSAFNRKKHNHCL